MGELLSHTFVGASVGDFNLESFFGYVTDFLGAVDHGVQTFKVWL